jgi:hypothetical protein
MPIDPSILQLLGTRDYYGSSGQATPGQPSAPMPQTAQSGPDMSQLVGMVQQMSEPKQFEAPRQISPDAPQTPAETQDNYAFNFNSGVPTEDMIRGAFKSVWGREPTEQDMHNYLTSHDFANQGAIEDREKYVRDILTPTERIPIDSPTAKVDKYGRPFLDKQPTRLLDIMAAMFPGSISNASWH